jgi:hypothetical protein
MPDFSLLGQVLLFGLLIFYFSFFIPVINFLFFIFYYQE